MSENKQLVRKNNGGGYNNVYPYSYTETVKDKKTGKSLEEILVSTNFLYLPYRDSKAATRLQVDERYRRKGLWVQYVTDLGSVIVEYYNSSDISDTKWADDKYWAPYNSAQFNPGTIGLDALSQEAKDYLLTNSPVNTEDITRDNQSRLQLADRAYNPASFSGKGYKILRQNILNGTNVLAQSMILSANTVYEIRYDYDLQGQEVTIPEGCVLDFQGGSFNNGNVTFNNTEINNNNNIFNNITIGGYINGNIYFDWFTPYKVNIIPQNTNIDTNDNILTNIINYLYLNAERTNQRNNVIFGKGIYPFNNQINIQSGLYGIGFYGKGVANTALVFPNGYGFRGITGGDIGDCIFKDFWIEANGAPFSFYVNPDNPSTDRFNALHDNIFTNLGIYSRGNSDFVFGANMSWSGFLYHNKFDNSGIYIRFQYFDTDLNKPIWWIGSRWVDATGATV